MGRLLSVGDIHGCINALRTLAELVPFRDDDVLITLGDYIDRGPDSYESVEWLVRYAKRRKLIALRGNHEAMLLEARQPGRIRDEWLKQGGEETLLSYSPFGDEGRFEDVPYDHWDFFLATRNWYETPRHIFVHANLDPKLPLNEQSERVLHWQRFDTAKPHFSGKIMICGHSPQREGEPVNLGFAVCIDTWAFGEGWLTCLEPASGRYWQANEDGRTRTGTLTEPQRVRR